MSRWEVRERYYESQGSQGWKLFTLLALMVLGVLMLSSSTVGPERTVVVQIAGKQPAYPPSTVLGMMMLYVPNSRRVCIYSPERSFCAPVSKEVFSSVEVGQTVTVGIQDTRGDGYRINWLRH